MQLLDRFLTAAATGNLADLVGVLARDVKLQSDGGGNALAVLVPVQGQVEVARLLHGARLRLMPHDLAPKLALINGQPGIVNLREGKPFSVLTFDVNPAGKIQTVYIITNPDKLKGVARLAQSE
jgi:hypothetical protein